MSYKRLWTRLMQRRVRRDVRAVELPVIGNAEMEELMENHALLEPSRPLEQVCGKTQPAGR